ncbi:hypothetical protein DPMN_012618 [Dreissena polymorpha]|uniref:Uncharacterized protein n=1 Tax=Dreissena polymorpha TaxID=45954 RepID=A0A9D4N6B7_DREPO|nr:hypothetical protein DPMN_012618 [Dreissena polymorpha]
MARQRPTLLVMGPCIVEIDRIVIRKVQYQLEVNRCRNEEIIVKGNFGWAWPMWAGRPRVGNGAMHKVQYQFEVNRRRNKEIIVKGNFGWAWPMWAGRPRINRIVIREVQYQFEVNRCNFGWAWPMWAGRLRIDHIYQFEVNRCRNEEIIVKGNFGWAWPMWAGRPMVGNGPCIVEIDRIVIREVQYQFEDNRCRNEEIIEIVARTDRRTDGGDNHNIPTLFKKRGDKDNFGRVWPIMDGGAPGLVMGPYIVEMGRIVLRDVQYQFAVNRCRNEEIIVKGNFGWAWPMWPGRPGLVMGPCIYQFEVIRCRNEEIIVKGNFGWAWPM